MRWLSSLSARALTTSVSLLRRGKGRGQLPPANAVSSCSPGRQLRRGVGAPAAPRALRTVDKPLPSFKLVALDVCDVRSVDLTTKKTNL